MFDTVQCAIVNENDLVVRWISYRLVLIEAIFIEFSNRWGDLRGM